jgi:Coenzyme PQQ synthesis protein D (PqqD)
LGAIRAWLAATWLLMIAAMSKHPSRLQDIDVVEVADGFVVYHPERDRVHFFNHTAAVVLELCDGTKTDSEITNLVQHCYELPEPPESEVARCLSQFRDEGLVSDDQIAS